jgi:hypothetical protein
MQSGGTTMTNIHRQYRLQVLTLASGGIAYAALAIYASPFWLLGLLVMIVCAGYGLTRLECELCGDPLLLREHHLFGRDIAVWWPVLPEQCQTCDHPVGAPEPAVESPELATAV